VDQGKGSTTGRAGAVLAAWLAVALLPATANATFPGTNGRIAFTTDRFHPNYDVASVNPSGTNTKHLTNSPDTSSEPRYSPNGNSILYVHTGVDGTHVWSMDADGTNKHELDLGAADTFLPAWAPGGSRLAYCRGNAIWTANLNGTNRVQITGAAVIHQDPDWSPNGKWILYDRVNGAGSDHDIIRIDAKGGGEIDLTPSKSVSDLSPSWSPSSNRIVFESFQNQQIDHSDIFTMTAAGTGRQHLVGGPADDTEPVYSPDGQSIAYVSNATGNYELWRKPALPNAPATQITTNPALDFLPDWQAR
jgi:TolB protein